MSAYLTWTCDNGFDGLYERFAWFAGEGDFFYTTYLYLPIFLNMTNNMCCVLKNILNWLVVYCYLPLMKCVSIRYPYQRCTLLHFWNFSKRSKNQSDLLDWASLTVSRCICTAVTKEFVNAMQSQQETYMGIPCYENWFPNKSS